MFFWGFGTALLFFMSIGWIRQWRRDLHFADMRRRSREHRGAEIKEQVQKIADTEICFAPEIEAQLLDEAWRTCIHEAGHVVLLLLDSPHTLKVVTVVRHQVAPGDVVDGLVDHDRMKGPAFIRMLYAGFLAEELIFGRGSCGASDDLKKIVFKAWDLLQFGDEDFSFENPMMPDLFEALGILGESGASISELSRLAIFCGEIREETRGILLREKRALLAIAEALREKRTLGREEVISLWECTKHNREGS